MKKLISFLLVIMMLCSMSVSAFATDDTKIGSSAKRDSFTDETATGDVNTELWLQVDADGQIDVTVPLVLVFRTNIDGGKATSPGAYSIANMSSSDLVVTKIETKTETTSNPMTLKEFNTTTLARDEYKVQLTVPDGVTLGVDDDDKTTQLNNGWDLSTPTHENDKLYGGLFELAKPESGDTLKSTRIIADMETGSLSFVTTRNEDATTGADAGMNNEYGVKLLTVTFTVAIDTSDAIGEEIIYNKDATEAADRINIDVESGLTWANGTDNT